MLFSIGHVRKGFSWYLDELLDSLKSEQIVGLIGTKSLKEDMKRLFDLDVETHDKRDYPKPIVELTEGARNILKAFFANEYATLRRLGRLAPTDAHVLSFL